MTDVSNGTKTKIQALCEIHDRLIKLILSVCMSNSISMELKNEALSHSLALIESSTHPILIQLLDADHLWSLLQQTVNLIGRPEGTLRSILYFRFRPQTESGVFSRKLV